MTDLDLILFVDKHVLVIHFEQIGLVDWLELAERLIHGFG